MKTATTVPSGTGGIKSPLGPHGILPWAAHHREIQRRRELNRHSSIRRNPYSPGTLDYARWKALNE